MAFYTGRTGSLRFGTTAGNTQQVAKIRDWNLDVNVELISTNSIDSGVNTFTPGVKGATGSATLVYYRLSQAEIDDTNTASFISLIDNIIKTGNIEESDRVYMELNVGSDAADDIGFFAYITSASVSVSTGELSVVPIQFTVDGDFVDIITGN